MRLQPFRRSPARIRARRSGAKLQGMLGPSTPIGFLAWRHAGPILVAHCFALPWCECRYRFTAQRFSLRAVGLALCQLPRRIAVCRLLELGFHQLLAADTASGTRSRLVSHEAPVEGGDAAAARIFAARHFDVLELSCWRSRPSDRVGLEALTGGLFREHCLLPAPKTNSWSTCGPAMTPNSVRVLLAGWPASWLSYLGGILILATQWTGGGFQ